MCTLAVCTRQTRRWHGLGRRCPGRAGGLALIAGKQLIAPDSMEGLGFGPNFAAEGQVMTDTPLGAVGGADDVENDEGGVFHPVCHARGI